MSLSEFVASPAVEKVASNLPRPVAPVRKPVNRSEPNTQQVLPSQNSTPPYSASKCGATAGC